jgi:hypothetical protein
VSHTGLLASAHSLFCVHSTQAPLAAPSCTQTFLSPEQAGAPDASQPVHAAVPPDTRQNGVVDVALQPVLSFGSHAV